MKVLLKYLVNMARYSNETEGKGKIIKLKFRIPISNWMIPYSVIC